MRKTVLVAAMTGLLLSGCTTTSDIAIQNDGKISGTVAIGFPKSAMRNVHTLADWTDVANKNNLTEQSSDGLNCATADNVVASTWDYSCAITGNDVTVLNDSATSMLSSVQLDRDGQTLNMATQDNSDALGEQTGLGGMGLSGISLVTATSKITVQGTCTTNETSGVTIVADNTSGDTTVTMEWDQSSPQLKASCTLTAPPQSATSTTLTTQTTPESSLASALYLKAKATPSTIQGSFEFFDGDKLLTKVPAVAGEALYRTDPMTTGSHNITARFKPADFWTQASSTSTPLTISGMDVKGPKATCAKKIGAKCQVVLSNSAVKPSTVTYQWYNGTKVIKGAKNATFTRRKGDTKLSVMVTFKKSGYVTRAWSLKVPG